VEDKETTYRKALEDLDKESLIKIILDQSKLIEELQKQNQELQKRIEELERASKRQAAPFRIEEDKKKLEKKRSGAKKGHKGHYRTPSGPIDAREEVKLECCPKCNGSVKEQKPVRQVVEELVVKPYRLELITYKGKCSSCGIVYSSHPLQSSTSAGSAGCHLGKQAITTALLLNHRYGMRRGAAPKRKVAELFTEEFHLPLSIGGLVQMQHKMADAFEQEYKELKQKARDSGVVYVDETSWYVGEPNHWLWNFSNSAFTYYAVEQSRGRAVVQQLLGDSYAGVLVSDCLSVYDDVCESQQKCFAHHLKAIKQALAHEPESQYLKKWKKLLQKAVAWKEQKANTSQDAYKGGCADIALQATGLLKAPRASPWEEKIGNRLDKQKDHLFTFLLKDNVEPTNNRAERSLRPAVVHRKISCGNKTRKGADSWQILASVVTTAKQNATPFDQKVEAALNKRLQR
jgi:transposase